MDPWLCWFVVLHGGYPSGADTRSFLVVLVGASNGFYGDSRGGWLCWFSWWLVVVVSGGYVFFFMRDLTKFCAFLLRDGVLGGIVALYSGLAKANPLIGFGYPFHKGHENHDMDLTRNRTGIMTPWWQSRPSCLDPSSSPHNLLTEVHHPHICPEKKVGVVGSSNTLTFSVSFLCHLSTQNSPPPPRIQYIFLRCKRRLWWCDEHLEPSAPPTSIFDDSPARRYVFSLGEVLFSRNVGCDGLVTMVVMNMSRLVFFGGACGGASNGFYGDARGGWLCWFLWWLVAVVSGGYVFLFVRDLTKFCAFLLRDGVLGVFSGGLRVLKGYHRDLFMESGVPINFASRLGVSFYCQVLGVFGVFFGGSKVVLVVEYELVLE
ncbi:transmembrane protein, putative [Medicago truncatula]|uniref:Transmembrane protein, putative n=1 Tax=Medicago truncatula TaxID=3880 RepID=G7JPB3_MEDTR|nr:transmembrane protein, putative [Medicago truncatula]